MIKDLFNSKPSSTAYLNGFKAISTISIVLYHCCFSRVNFPFKNGENLQELLNGAFYQPIHASFSTVELFFIIGGILTAKTLKKNFEPNNNKIKWIMRFYIKRFSRLVPVTLLVEALILTCNSKNISPYSFDILKENFMKFLSTATTFNSIDDSKIVSLNFTVTRQSTFQINHNSFINF